MTNAYFMYFFLVILGGKSNAIISNVVFIGIEWYLIWRMCFFKCAVQNVVVKVALGLRYYVLVRFQQLMDT